MPNPISPEETARRTAALHLGIAQGNKMSVIAKSLGLAPNNFSEWRRKMHVTKEAEPEISSPPPSPRETRDATFWKRKATDAIKALADAEHIAEELAGVRRVQPSPPIWAARTAGKHGNAILIAHTSDLHMGEVIEAGEIEGINGYDPDIARARMRRYFEAVCQIGPRWLEDGKCDGVLLTMGGDLVSGDIHEELTRTNALTAHEQIRAVVEVYEAGIKMLADNYGAVHVAAVSGNHGRTTLKNTAKLIGRLSYDIMAADMVRDRLRDDKRVTFSIASGADVRVPVYGKTILVTHGHMMGAGGGMGFAGPVLPIIRGGNKVKLQGMSAGLSCDLILMGHYHTSAAPPGILANGSVVGYGEYANMIRASVEAPKQWLARFSAKWGLADHLAVQLDEPTVRMRMKS